MHKSINIIQHKNRLKDRNHKVISRDIGNVPDKVHHSFIIKAQQNVSKPSRHILQNNKGNKPTINFHTKRRKTKKIFLPFSQLLLSVVFKVTPKSLWQEKQTRGHLNIKHFNETLFTDAIILKDLTGFPMKGTHKISPVAEELWPLKAAGAGACLFREVVPVSMPRSSGWPYPMYMRTGQS